MVMAMETSLRLSKTKVNAYISCPEHYRLEYHLDIHPRRKALNLVIGLTTHAAIAANLRARMEGRSFAEKELSFAIDSLWKAYNIENTDFVDEKALEEGKRDSHRLAMIFIEKARVNPFLVEHPFDLPIIDITTGEVLEEARWAGAIDIVDQEGVIFDIKTKARQGTEFDVKTSLELTGYAYAYSLINKELNQVPVSLINLVKTKQVQLQELRDVRNPYHFRRFFQTLAHVVNGIRDERFYPNPGVHCIWCEYKPFCEADLDAILEKFGEDNYQKFLQC